MIVELGVGTKVVGFSFEGRSYKGLIWNPMMEDCIGKVGLIGSYNTVNKTYYVVFGTAGSWHYPADMIQEYLVKKS